MTVYEQTTVEPLNQDPIFGALCASFVLQHSLPYLVDAASGFRPELSANIFMSVLKGLLP